MVTVRIENVSWGPSGALPVVRGVTLNVASGETLGIVGPNGAGKSSLLRCLYRVNRPQQGIVTLDGIDVWSMSARECARVVAAVLQEVPAALGLSVRHIIEMGRTPHRALFEPQCGEDESLVEWAAAVLGLDELLQRDFATLSGGEKQRVLVARAIAQQPRLLVLDEPTNHLDIRHQLDVLAVLRELAPTIVTSLHDLNLALEHCDRVCVIDHGQIVADGSPEEALDPGVIEQVFGVRASLRQDQGTGAPWIAFDRQDPAAGLPHQPRRSDAP